MSNIYFKLQQRALRPKGDDNRCAVLAPNICAWLFVSRITQTNSSVVFIYLSRIFVRLLKINTVINNAIYS